MNKPIVLKVNNWKDVPKDFVGIVEYGEYKYWVKNRELHREDGPAVEYFDGSKDFYLEGRRLQKDDYLREILYMKNQAKINKTEEIFKLTGFDSIPVNYSGVIEDINGDRYWVKNGITHREDGPAIERASGLKIWILNGILFSSEKEYLKEILRMADPDISFKKVNSPDEIHRNYSGAVEYPDGAKYFYLNGKVHRTDGPAIFNPNGNRYWQQNNLLHRVDGPAVESYDGRVKQWWVNGKPLSETEFNQQFSNKEKGNKPMSTINVNRLNDVPSDFTGIAIHSNGSTLHYKNGNIHRENGPAIERRDGTSEFKLNGVTYSESQFNEMVKKMTTKEKPGTSTTMSNVKKVMTSDFKKGLKRAGARKVVGIAADLLCNFLGSGKTKRENNSFKAALKSRLESESGRAFLGFAIGAFGSLIQTQLPEKYHGVFAEMAEEFRVEAIAYGSGQVMEFLSGPAYQASKFMLAQALDSIMDNSSEEETEETSKVRVDAGATTDPHPMNDMLPEATETALTAKAAQVSAN